MQSDTKTSTIFFEDYSKHLINIYYNVLFQPLDLNERYIFINEIKYYIVSCKDNFYDDHIERIFYVKKV